MSDGDQNPTTTPYTLDFVLVNTGGTFALPAGTTTVNQLVIGGGSAQLNVGTSTLVVDYRGASPFAAINAQIVSGRNGGAWNGSGIVTTAASGSLTTLGIAEIGGDVIVKFTYAGDANLDGKINIDDYGLIDTSVGLGLTGWFNGDFNYDGKINIDDYGIIDVNVGVQGSPMSSSAVFISRPLERPQADEDEPGIAASFFADESLLP